MKLSNDRPAVQRTGDLTETNFTIKATAKAFQILSSGLYQNKIRAIVRELSCNAYDAHKAAGNEKTPIEIKLPTSLENTFYVKDFGTGLDDDGILHLYTTYFESTKADSNDFIGALGLGSKSPFSYARSFSVEARHNGVKRFYTAFINESGTPAITKLTEEATTEPNGLTVSLQVKRDDCYKFEEEAKHALMYFNPKPNVVGRKDFSAIPVKHTVDGGDWKVREAAYEAGMRGPYVLQGFVAYPLNAEILKQEGLSQTAQALLELNLDIIVPMGDVEVAASREGLSYDKRTLDNLKRRLSQISAALHATVQKEFDKCSSLWSARMKYMTFEHGDRGNEHMRAVFNTLKKRAPFKWKGQDIDDVLSLDVSKIDNTDICLYYKSSGSKGMSREQIFTPTERAKFKDKKGNFVYELRLKLNLPVLVDDLYGGNDVIRQWWEERQSKAKTSYTDEYQYVLVLRPNSRKVEAESKAEMLKIIADLGDPAPLLVSGLGFTRTKVAYYKKRAADVLYKWTGFAMNGGSRKDQLRRTFSKNCWTRQQVTMGDGGFYVPIEKFAIKHEGTEREYFDEVLSSAVTLGYMKSSDDVIGMSADELKIAKGEGTWLNVFEHAQTEFTKANVNHTLSNVIVAATLIEKFGRGMTTNVIVPWKKLRDTVVDCDFKTLIDDVIKFAANKTEHQLVRKMLKQIDGTYHDAEMEYVEKTVDAIMHRWDKVQSQYEMFALLAWSNLDAKQIQIVVNYINTIEATRKKS